MALSANEEALLIYIKLQLQKPAEFQASIDATLQAVFGDMRQLGYSKDDAEQELQRLYSSGLNLS
jgi:hypothetical protein